MLLTGFLGVQDFDVEDVDGIDGPPWTLDRVRELNACGLSIFVYPYVTYD